MADGTEKGIGEAGDLVELLIVVIEVEELIGHDRKDAMVTERYEGVVEGSGILLGASMRSRTWTALRRRPPSGNRSNRRRRRENLGGLSPDRFVMRELDSTLFEPSLGQKFGERQGRYLEDPWLS